MSDRSNFNKCLITIYVVISASSFFSFWGVINYYMVLSCRRFELFKAKSYRSGPETAKANLKSHFLTVYLAETGISVIMIWQISRECHLIYFWFSVFGGNNLRLNLFRTKIAVSLNIIKSEHNKTAFKCLQLQFSSIKGKYLWVCLFGKSLLDFL